MGLRKCPRCEINYILDDAAYCTVCRREMKGEREKQTFELCSVCNENPALPGKDLCLDCIKEMGRADAVVATSTDDQDIENMTDNLEVDEGVSTMDEIAVDDEEIPAPELGEIDRELSLDEALEEEEAGGDDEENEDDI